MMFLWKKTSKSFLISAILLCCCLMAVSAQTKGDVNNDGSITIVDALIVAQYTVGLNPAVFNAANADVNNSSAIDIIDALMIAQYYVGLITQFPGGAATATSTPATTRPSATATPASGPFNGYTLYGAMSGNSISLVDMNKTVVHTWNCTNSCGYSQYLLADGNILCSGTYRNSSISGGGDTGMVQKIDWNGNVLWKYIYSSSTYQSHHDIEPLPNGNVLMIAWELKTAAEATAAGRSKSSVIWPDKIVEIQPSGTTGGTIVWEWHAWDHLVQEYDSTKANYGVVKDHPELLNVNLRVSSSGGMGFSSADWMHVNGISYNPQLDQIVFSSHYLNEFYVIDHSTTTQQAASHTGGKSGKGGDFLYRWGCPSNYGRAGSQVFFTVHNAYWVPTGLPGAGHIIAFNNGAGRSDGSYSSIDEVITTGDSNGNYAISTGLAFGPSSATWTYKASGFYSSGQSGSQRLANGNTLICETGGTIFEVTSAGTLVWEHKPSSGMVARALRYAPDYPGLAKLNQ